MRYFQLPTSDKDRYLQWLKLLLRLDLQEDQIRTSKLYVCSDHFIDNMFLDPMDRDHSSLHLNAIPTLMLHLDDDDEQQSHPPSELQGDAMEVKIEMTSDVEDDSPVRSVASKRGSNSTTSSRRPQRQRRPPGRMMDYSSSLGLQNDNHEDTDHAPPDSLSPPAKRMRASKTGSGGSKLQPRSQVNRRLNSRSPSARLDPAIVNDHGDTDVDHIPPPRPSVTLPRPKIVDNECESQLEPSPPVVSQDNGDLHGTTEKVQEEHTDNHEPSEADEVPAPATTTINIDESDDDRTIAPVKQSKPSIVHKGRQNKGNESDVDELAAENSDEEYLPDVHSLSEESGADEDDADEGEQSHALETYPVALLEQGTEEIKVKDRRGWEWSTVPPEETLVNPFITVKTEEPGPTLTARQLVEESSPESAFLLFFDETMRKNIVEFTNASLQFPRPGRWKDLTMEELNAWFGLHIQSGAHLLRNENLSEFWNHESGLPYFYASMPRDRFVSIGQYIQLDDPEEVARQLLQGNRGAHVCRFWDAFAQNLKKMFVPAHELVLHEMLSTFRGENPHLVLIRNKFFGKYGTRILAVTDVEHQYICNAHLYIPDKKTTGVGHPRLSNCALRTTPIGEQTRALISMFYGSGRHLFMDDYFCELKNSELLLEHYNLSVTGSVRLNRHLPRALSDTSERTPGSTIFLFHEDKQMMASYCEKKDHTVTVYSTHCLTKNTVEDHKPQVVVEYERGKAAADMVEKLMVTTSVKRQTRRWIVSLLFSMIDMALLNAYAVYTHLFPHRNLKRRAFYLEVGKRLCLPFIRSRSKVGLQGHVLQAMKAVLGDDDDPCPAHEFVRGSGRRHFCFECQRQTHRVRKRKMATKLLCAKCDEPVCKSHVLTFCPQCVNYE